MTKTYRQDPPQDFNELLELWYEIKSFLGPHSDSQIDYFDNALTTGSWAWDPVFEQRHPSNIDRLGEILLGPLFVSEKHPWPIKDGLPMIPLLQLDLDKASDKGGINIGTGLLQAFVAINDTLGQRVRIRTIERTDVAVEALLPAPPFTEVTETFASVDWAKPNLAADESPCLQIVQYAPKRFSFSPPSPLSNRFNFQKYSPDQQMKMRRFDEMLEGDLSEFSGGGFHLLGTFQPIQYTQTERSWPLFSLESEYGFNFSDGQGQVFFETDDSGEISFYFDWSCY